MDKNKITKANKAEAIERIITDNIHLLNKIANMEKSFQEVKEYKMKEYNITEAELLNAQTKKFAKAIGQAVKFSN